MRVSILDQSPIATGSTASEALAQTVRTAQLADDLGYHRFWVSEHHDAPGLAGSTPEVLLAHIGAKTKRIRLGSGGVMLPHYSSYKVAENFRMLEALYPGRIDLGVGRAPGGMPRSTIALQGGRVPKADYSQQVADLIAYITDSLPDNHPLYGLRARPIPEGVPELWLLGSSYGSAAIAAEHGTAFTFAHFINAEGGVEAVQMYRDRFQPSRLYAEPEASVAVFVFCADTAEAAERLAMTMDLSLLMLANGQRMEGTPTYEMARDYPYTARERMVVRENRERMIVGDPVSVRQQLEAFARRYGVDEVIVSTRTPDFEDRLRTFELLADAMGLKGQ